MSHFTPPGDCPVCGTPVPEGAKSCRECGSCDHTGWNSERHIDGLNLPDTDSEKDTKSRIKLAPHEDAKSAKQAAIVFILLIIVTLAWFGLKK